MSLVVYGIPTMSRFNEQENSIYSDYFYTINNIENGRVGLRLVYNTFEDVWYMDIELDNTFVVKGKKIVLEVNLIPEHLGIGALFANDVEGNYRGERLNPEATKFTLPDDKIKLFYIPRKYYDPI